jgi:hypothetical protein
MKRLLALFGFSLFSHAALAGPQINVGVVYDYLGGDKSTYLKRVFNGGDSTASSRSTFSKSSTTPMARPGKFPWRTRQMALRAMA